MAVLWTERWYMYGIWSLFYGDRKADQTINGSQTWLANQWENHNSVAGFSGKPCDCRRVHPRKILGPKAGILQVSTLPISMLFSTTIQSWPSSLPTASLTLWDTMIPLYESQAKGGESHRAVFRKTRRRVARLRTHRLSLQNYWLLGKKNSLWLEFQDPSKTAHDVCERLVLGQYVLKGWDYHSNSEWPKSASGTIHHWSTAEVWTHPQFVCF